MHLLICTHCIRKSSCANKNGDALFLEFTNHYFSFNVYIENILNLLKTK